MTTPMLHFDGRLKKLGVRHETTTRADGDMRREENRSAFFERAGIKPEKVFLARQVHGDVLAEAGSDKNFSADPPEADGWLVSGAGLGAAILTADCLPVFFWDRAGEKLALIHAGWRGVAKKFPLKTARQMVSCGKPPVSVRIGPHIKPCCFEVSAETASAFPPECVIGRRGKIYVDLAAETLRQLSEAGIKPEDVSVDESCTCCGGEFFSFRRDKGTCAMLSYIFKP